MSDQKNMIKKQLAKLADYKRTFETPHGRRVLHDMMLQHCMMTTTYVPNDSHQSAMREGERQVVIRILAKLKTDISKLEKHLEEANDEAKELI